MIGTWIPSSGGAASASGPPPTVVSEGSTPDAGSTRWALYDGMAFTRKAGRQSRSRQATTLAGCRARTRRATMSQNPRTALTGVPSSAVSEDGTP